MAALTAAEYAEMPVRITKDGKVILGDGIELPGCIPDKGITIRLGEDAGNLLTITFMVGEVTVEDPHALV